MSLSSILNHSPQQSCILRLSSRAFAASIEHRIIASLHGTNMYIASTLKHASVTSPVNEEVICEPS